MKCPSCNKKMKTKNGPYHYTESGLSNVYLAGIKLFECTCGEEMASLPNIINLHDTIAFTIVNKTSLLNGKEIKFLRKNIRVSGKDFADIIGVDKSTISRWENKAQKISKSHDRLIRLVYSNIKGVKENKIKNLMNDIFKDIKPEIERCSRITIPSEEWANSDFCFA